MSDTIQTTTTPECESCERAIVPGDHRVPTIEGPRHHLCDLREQLKDRYHFHIGNPQSTQAIGFFLWKQTDYGEQPVIQNTGGLDVFHSRSSDVGDAIQPSDAFFDSIASAHHWLMCLMRGYDPEEIDDTIESFYHEGRVPDHERWGIHLIVGHLHPPGKVIPELGDIRDYADGHTDWKTPEAMEVADE